MPDLRRYHQKRDPDTTPEPFGAERARRARAPDAPHGFVVQQHAATRMHWDLRLEIEDVLVSFAIPRGPSLDPQEKRLAVQTEDHPMGYADFEGVIPAGNYGAGAMIVWDRGIYHIMDGRSPAEGLANGKLDLLFQGHKLRSRFALVRIKGEDGKNWLLISKGSPAEDGSELVEAAPCSVYSGLTIDELRESVSRDREVGERLAALGAPERAPDVKKLRPMLAHSEPLPFSREGWLFELKYDGVRLLACKEGETVRLHTRAGNDRTSTYPEIARAISHLPLRSFVVDGEVVALDASGRSSFGLLQRRFTQTDPDAIERAQAEIPVSFYAFDLLFALGHDLRALPLVQRKQVLSLFAPSLGQVLLADHVEGDGEALFAAATDHELEGIVAKRADSRYEVGRRSKSWLKIKVPRSAPLVIAGWVAGRGSRGSLGSLVLAGYRDGALRYVGNAGSGLSEDTIAALLPALEALRVGASPFEGEPATTGRELCYARPELVCRVSYTEVTAGGQLRHPVFRELLPDVAPQDCPAPVPRASLPEPAAPAPERSGKLELTRLDKVFWPVEGYTKGDLLAYYEAIWPWLAPYLRDRPVVLTRYPDGIEGKHFYQKNAPEFTPEWVEREVIEGTDYFICNELRTLLYVINSGAIPLHVWSARRGDLERPDWLILDLDPKQAPFAHVVEIARYIHQLLDELETPHFAKTSGQDGLHVLVPLGARLDHRDATALAEVLARAVVADLPEIATVARPLAARGDKVYVDYLQNGRGKLIAAPFSVRPRPHAPVSTPLTWGQITRRLDPSRWTIKTTPRRMGQKGDPMTGVLSAPADVERLLSRLAERL